MVKNYRFLLLSTSIQYARRDSSRYTSSVVNKRSSISTAGTIYETFICSMLSLQMNCLERRRSTRESARSSTQHLPSLLVSKDFPPRGRTDRLSIAITTQASYLDGDDKHIYVHKVHANNVIPLALYKNTNNFHVIAPSRVIRSV